VGRIIAPRMSRHLPRAVAGACWVAAMVWAAGCQGETPWAGAGAVGYDWAVRFATATPIKHLVVVFGENISFDHYFGTYPRAENQPGEVPFHAAPDTPPVNNLVGPLDPTDGFVPRAGVDLLGANPNFTADA